MNEWMQWKFLSWNAIGTDTHIHTLFKFSANAAIKSNKLGAFSSTDNYFIWSGCDARIDFFPRRRVCSDSFGDYSEWNQNPIEASSLSPFTRGSSRILACERDITDKDCAPLEGLPSPSIRRICREGNCIKWAQTRFAAVELALCNRQRGWSRVVARWAINYWNYKFEANFALSPNGNNVTVSKCSFYVRLICPSKAQPIISDSIRSQMRSLTWQSQSADFFPLALFCATNVDSHMTNTKLITSRGERHQLRRAWSAAITSVHVKTKLL